MSMLQKLQSVYFDTVRLEEDLVRLPTTSSFWQNGNSASGKYSISTFTLVGEGLGNPICSGLIRHLDNLRKNLLSLEIDLGREIGRLLPEEISEGLEPHLFILQKEISALNSLIDQIEEYLTVRCESRANEGPAIIQDNNVKLQQCLYQLERIVCTVYGRSRLTNVF